MGDLYKPVESLGKEGRERSGGHLGGRSIRAGDGELGFGSTELYLAKVTIGKIPLQASA